MKFYPSKTSGAPRSATPVRSAVRFPLQLPVTLSTGVAEVPATTIDVSSTGVLLETATPVAVGTQVRWAMHLSAEAMGAEGDIAVECAGRVVGMREGQPIRIAVVIDEYRIKEEAA